MFVLFFVNDPIEKIIKSTPIFINENLEPF